MIGIDNSFLFIILSSLLSCLAQKPGRLQQYPFANRRQYNEASIFSPFNRRRPSRLAPLHTYTNSQMQPGLVPPPPSASFPGQHKTGGLFAPSVFPLLPNQRTPSHHGPISSHRPPPKPISQNQIFKEASLPFQPKNPHETYPRLPFHSVSSPKVPFISTGHMPLNPRQHFNNFHTFGPLPEKMIPTSDVIVSSEIEVTTYGQDLRPHRPPVGPASVVKEEHVKIAPESVQFRGPVHNDAPKSTSFQTINTWNANRNENAKENVETHTFGPLGGFAELPKRQQTSQGYIFEEVQENQIVPSGSPNIYEDLQIREIPKDSFIPSQHFIPYSQEALDDNEIGFRVPEKEQLAPSYAPSKSAHKTIVSKNRYRRPTPSTPRPPPPFNPSLAPSGDALYPSLDYYSYFEGTAQHEEPDRLTILLKESKFNCQGKKDGYYADEELDCEVFHFCQNGAKHSWLCPNSASFHQVHLICMPQSEDNICEKSSTFHFINDFLYKELQDNKTYAQRYYPKNFQKGIAKIADEVAISGPRDQLQLSDFKQQKEGYKDIPTKDSFRSPNGGLALHVAKADNFRFETTPREVYADSPSSFSDYSSPHSGASDHPSHGRSHATQYGTQVEQPEETLLQNNSRASESLSHNVFRIPEEVQIPMAARRPQYIRGTKVGIL